MGSETLTVILNCRKAGGTLTNAELIVAQYCNDILICADFFSAASDNLQQISGTLRVHNDTEYIKAFLWTRDGMAPLSASWRMEIASLVK